MRVSRKTVLLIAFLPMLGLLLAAMATAWTIILTGNSQPWATISSTLASASIVWTVGWWWILRKHDEV